MGRFALILGRNAPILGRRRYMESDHPNYGASTTHLSNDGASRPTLGRIPPTKVCSAVSVTMGLVSACVVHRPRTRPRCATFHICGPIPPTHRLAVLWLMIDVETVRQGPSIESAVYMTAPYPPTGGLFGNKKTMMSHDRATP